jgi:hypothetical protein
MYTALRGSKDLAQLFIDNGADTDFNCCGTTPLIAAALALHKPLVTFFMERAFFLPPAPEKVQLTPQSENPSANTLQTTQPTRLLDILCVLKQLQKLYEGLSNEILTQIFVHVLRKDEPLKEQARERVFDIIVRCRRDCAYPSFLIPLVAENMVPFVLNKLSAIRDNAPEHFNNEYVLFTLIHSPQVVDGERWVRPSNDTVKSMFDLSTINRQTLCKNIAERLAKLRYNSE